MCIRDSQTSGIFELRPFFWKHKKRINIYADARTLNVGSGFIKANSTELSIGPRVGVGEVPHIVQNSLGFFSNTANIGPGQFFSNSSVTSLGVANVSFVANNTGLFANQVEITDVVIKGGGLIGIEPAKKNVKTKYKVLKIQSKIYT